MLVLLVTLLTLLAMAPVPARGAYHTVSPDVCSYRPLKSPTSVECDLTTTDTMVISARGLPATTRRLRVTNADRVQVARNALSALHSPESIHLENITVLTIGRNSPEAGVRQGQVTITLNRIGYAQLDRGSLSHWKEKILNISITDIGNTCLIRSGAIVSASASTNVLLENIPDGHFFPGTFATTLGRLTLRNVTRLAPCQQSTFGGHIRKLSLTSVTLGGIEEGCFQAHQIWGSLEVRSSKLGDVSERGLQGRIGNVRIEQSTLGHVRQDGFDLDVSSLSIHDSSIEMLAEDSLNVRASGELFIQGSNITTVSKNAFRLLSSRKAGQGIELSQLVIDNADNGSLSISDVTSLVLRELQIRIPCECDIREQMHLLFFGGEPQSPLTKRGMIRLFQYAERNILCLQNDTSSSLWEYHCTECHPQLDAICNATYSNDELVETPSASAVLFWIPFCASLGGFLLGAIITFCMVRRYRRRTFHQRHSYRPGQVHDQPGTEADRYDLGDLPRKGDQVDAQSAMGKKSCEVPLTTAQGSKIDLHVCVNVSEASACTSVRENNPCDGTYEKMSDVKEHENIWRKDAHENIHAGCAYENAPYEGAYENMPGARAYNNIPGVCAYENTPGVRVYENVPGAARSEDEHLYEEISKFRRKE